MRLAQGHNVVTPVRLELVAPRSLVKHSTTEPPRSLRGMFAIRLVYLTLTFDIKVISMICTLRCHLHTISNSPAKYEHHLPKKKDDFALQALIMILSILTLTFDFKVIAVVCNFPFNLHTICNYFVKYKHLQQNERGFHLKRYKTAIKRI